MAITPPTPDADRSVLRAVLESVAQFEPVTAALTRLYQTTHPAKFETALATWRDDVSSTSNDHEARLSELEAQYRPRLKLSDNAQFLARWLCLASPLGLADPVEFDEIRSAMTSLSKRDIEDAAAELKIFGLAETSAVIGQPVRLVTPTYELFALFDPIVVQTSPQNDAVEVARLALELDVGHAPELEARLGWPKRRLNPSLALVVQLVAPGRVRKVIQPNYVTVGFSLSGEERVRFRHLIEEADRHAA